jgi:hypothetical protein
MLPYIGFFLSYLIYVIWIFDMDQQYDKETGEQKDKHVGAIVLSRFWMFMLLVYSAYFLWAEFKQAKSNPKRYITEIWNYTDFIPPFLIIIIVLGDVFVDMSVNEESITKFKYSIQALASFGMWLKIFYFLRIFR